MFEPLAIGNWTLKADVSDDRSTKNSNGMMGVNVARGISVTKTTAPTTMTLAMYSRARAGRSLNKGSSIIADRGDRRMRRWLTVAAMGAAVVFAGSVAQGQTAPGGPGGPGSTDGPRSYAGIVAQSAFG